MAPLALVGRTLELHRLGLAAQRERVAAEAVEVAAGDDATLLAVVGDRVAAGRPVLVTAPLPTTPATVDALVELAAGAAAPVGYAEPVVVSPVAAAGLAAAAGWALRRVDLVWAAPEGEPTTERARAAALALAALGGRDLPPATATGWAGEVEGVAVSVSIDVAASAVDWSLQVVADDHVARLEWAPLSGVEVDGRPVPVGSSPEDPAERLLAELGYRALVSGIAGAAAGRGGTVVPLGFARRVAAALGGATT